VLFSTILFCRFLLHPKMSLEDAVWKVTPPFTHANRAGGALRAMFVRSATRRCPSGCRSSSGCGWRPLLCTAGD